MTMNVANTIASTGLRIAVLGHLHHPIRAPYAGGLEVHTAHLIRGMQQRGHQMALFAKEGSEPSDVLHAVLPATFEVRGYPDEDQRDGQHKILDAAMEHAVNLVRNGDFDAVINNSLSPVPHTALRGVPVLHLLHTPALPRITALMSQTGWTPDRLHAYATVSQSNAAAWRPWIAGLEVIPNGIDLTRWAQDAPPVVGTAAWTGRITPEKGPHLAIEAARAAGLNLTLAGPIQDGHYFKSRIEPQLDANIRYAGHLTQELLRSLVGSAQVFISSPRWAEPFGLTTLEAMACGTPVAALPAGAMGELLGSGGGVLARSADSPALAEAIGQARGLDRSRVREQAAMFSLERMLESYESRLRILLGNRAAAGRSYG